jgi:peptidoglycan/LPS O-acetylase OafA/YrhL
VWRIALTLVAIAVVAGLAGWPLGIATRTRLAGAAFQYTLISLFFSGMLLLTLLGGTGRWTWLTTNRPLRFLGFISYGLYLIHQPYVIWLGLRIRDVPIWMFLLICIPTLAVLSAWGMLLEKATNTLVNKLVSLRKRARAA